MEQTNYIILPDGRVQRQYIETREPFGLSNELLRRMSGDAVVPYRDHSWPTGCVMGVGMDGRNHLAVKLPSLAISTDFSPAQDPGGPLYITPTWGSRHVSVSTTRTWTPPVALSLVLVASYDPKDRHGNPTMYLLLHEQNAGYRVPFLPNIFDDARVCTGPWVENDWAAYREKPVFEIVEWLVHGMSASRWNSDLWTGPKVNAAPKFLRWSAEPDNETQLDPGPDALAALTTLHIPSAPEINWLGGVTL